jgi:hypothetical protein
MKLPLSDIQIRDPYVLTLPKSREYLLFGSADKEQDGAWSLAPGTCGPVEHGQAQWTPRADAP